MRDKIQQIAGRGLIVEPRRREGEDSQEEEE